LKVIFPVATQPVWDRFWHDSHIRLFCFSIFRGPCDFLLRASLRQL